jgi:signal transduction histidine kinase
MAKGFYDETVERWASRPQRPISLRGLYRHGERISLERLLGSANFVREELATRLARELRQLELLPYIFMTNPNIVKVYDIYHHAFRTLIDFAPIKARNDDSEFVSTLQDLMNETVSVIELLAQGVSESHKRVPPQLLNVQGFLDKFLASRTGRRVLAEQHIEQHRQFYGKRDHGEMVGIINTNLSPLATAKSVLDVVNEICEKRYGYYPDVRFEGDLNVRLPMVEYHLRYILLELLKNAFRATVEYNRKITKRHFPDLPPVIVTIKEGEKYIIIRVSDQGGGMDEATRSQIFQFGYSTASPPSQSKSGFALITNVEEVLSPMSGLGFGLPLSRSSIFFYLFDGLIDCLEFTPPIMGDPWRFLPFKIGALMPSCNLKRLEASERRLDSRAY